MEEKPEWSDTWDYHGETFIRHQVKGCDKAMPLKFKNNHKCMAGAARPPVQRTAGSFQTADEAAPANEDPEYWESLFADCWKIVTKVIYADAEVEKRSIDMNAVASCVNSLMARRLENARRN